MVVSVVISVVFMVVMVTVSKKLYTASILVELLSSSIPREGKGKEGKGKERKGREGKGIIILNLHAMG